MDYYYGNPDRNCFSQKGKDNHSAETVKSVQRANDLQNNMAQNFKTSAEQPDENIRQSQPQTDSNGFSSQAPQPESPAQQQNVTADSGGQFRSPMIQPNFNNEEMRGSLQQSLAENIGEYVVIEFLIGTERLMRKQGILYFVGRSFVTLYDDTFNDYIVCDLFSIKFVYFYYPGDRPKRNYNVLPSANSSGGNGR